MTKRGRFNKNPERKITAVNIRAASPRALKLRRTKNPISPKKLRSAVMRLSLQNLLQGFVLDSEKAQGHLGLHPKTVLRKDL